MKSHEPPGGAFVRSRLTKKTSSPSMSYMDDGVTQEVGLVLRLVGFPMASYGGLQGIQMGLAKSTDHQSSFHLYSASIKSSSGGAA